MPREKGSTLSDDQKKKMKEGRLAKKLEREAAREKVDISNLAPTVKPLCIITGYEADAFDFFPAIRKTFRTIGKYLFLRKIEKEITKADIWDNPKAIHEYLSSYVEFTTDPKTRIKKPVREKKHRNYTMTEEHKQKLKEAREKAKGRKNA